MSDAKFMRLYLLLLALVAAATLVFWLTATPGAPGPCE